MTIRAAVVAIAILAAFITWPSVSGAIPPPPDWPVFHGGPLDDGAAPNSTLTTANAGSLGVQWATNMYGAALDSPVVAYNATLGKRLAYIGTEKGYVEAIDVATGRIVWGASLGSPIRTTPVVSNGAVYVGTFDSPTIYSLNATTGAVNCSVPLPQPIEASPLVATPPGGVATLYIGTNDGETADGPVFAINASTCAVEWSFTHYLQHGGVWTPMAYALDASGTPLIVFGSADPDSTEYAVNALTGARVWTYSVENPGTFDIGAGATISPPGTNGFADGVAYVPSKFGVMYAINLTTGARIWNTNFNSIASVTGPGRSTAALEGTDLVFGYNQGVFDLDATTGALKWQYQDPSKQEVLSSPAILGPNGAAIAAVADLSGEIQVLSLTNTSPPNPTPLYHYQTGGYVTASPAVSGGDLLVASSDGFLYDFAVGGGNEATLPSTAITAPADRSRLPNPNGNVTITGAASDGLGVAGVNVAIQSGGAGGEWWDAATGKWSSGPVDNPATVTSPGAATSTWSFSLPVPVHGATSAFSVQPSTSAPQATASPRWAAPGAGATITGSGFSPGETVSITLLGTTLGTATTDGSGHLPAATVTIPPTAAFGPSGVSVTGQTSGRMANAAIDISNAWPQFGDGERHQNNEPNDPTFFNIISPGSGIFLHPAWMYQSGAAIDGSPAVARGVAYAATTAGTVVALDVRNGAPIWTWTHPGGRGKIVGTPALDMVNHLVFVTANNGTLYAVNAASGSLAWSRHIGGLLSTPAFASGTVYLTTQSTSGSQIEAISENDALVWSATLGSATHVTPAVDAGRGVVVVGESNGRLAAFGASRGRRIWSVPIGGPVTASPSVIIGTVFVGTANHELLGINESTGQVKWTYETQGAVNSTPTVTNVFAPGKQWTVYDGDSTGRVYSLTASNGAFQFSFGLFKGPVTGVATVRSVLFAETQNGRVAAARTRTGLVLWRNDTGSKLSSSPAVLNGTLYVGMQDGHVDAFTTFGQAPIG